MGTGTQFFFVTWACDKLKTTLQTGLGIGLGANVALIVVENYGPTFYFVSFLRELFKI